MKNSFLLFFVFLAGCGDKSHDLEYYKAHHKERKAKIETCKSMSMAEVMADAECNAASNALLAGMSEDLKEKKNKSEPKPHTEFLMPH